MLAPVALFVFNRPEHTQKAVEALARNTLAKESDLIVFCDGAKRSEQTENVQHVRNYIHSLSNLNLFSSVTVHEQTENLGLAASTISGISQVIAQYGSVIMVEDDNLTSKDYLAFMNRALVFYKPFKRVGTISGYKLPICISPLYPFDVFCQKRVSTWGWGTWKDRWEKIDWDVSDYLVFKDNPRQREAFDKLGTDMSLMLDMQMNGEINSWSIRMGYHMFKNGLYTVVPAVSRVMNIGMDSSGAHCSPTTRYDVLLNEKMPKWYFFKPPFLNPRLNRKVADYCSS